MKSLHFIQQPTYPPDKLPLLLPFRQNSLGKARWTYAIISPKYKYYVEQSKDQWTTIFPQDGVSDQQHKF